MSAAESGRWSDLWRDDPVAVPDRDAPVRAIPAVRVRWEPIAVAILLGGTALLYLWNLAESGWANAYYSAAALAGSENWVAWLFGSFDPGNALTVDKTPASLWVMGLSVRLFGLSAWSVLVPQALMGVASVGLLYATVRRAAGPLAGFIAGAVLALTPVAALMFRFNNPDALLVLLLVGAAYLTVRGVESGATRWFVAAGVAVGFAFLAKMLQAYLVIPALTAVVLVASPVPLGQRVRQIVAAAVAVVVSSGWFVLLVELWPADARPFIGGSQTNSLIELILGYNGLGRITGNEIGRIGGGSPFSDGAGLFRLFGGEVGTEIGWLLPTALACGIALLLARGRSPRTDPVRAQVILWLGWLVVTGLVFSLMEGIFHEYYTVALAPAIGALVGIGAGYAWQHRDRLGIAGASVVAVIVAGSALWAAELLGSTAPAWNAWLIPVVIGGGLLAAIAIVGATIVRETSIQALAIVGATLVLLLIPGLAAVATAATPHTGAIPTAVPTATTGRGLGGRGGPPGLGGGNGQFAPPGGGNNGGGPFGFRTGPGGGGGFFGVPGGSGGSGNGGPGNGGPGNGGPGGGIGGLLDAGTPDPALVAALQENAGAYRWAAATTGSNNAAGLALASRTSVMSIGGFNGTDPAPTLEQFQAYVHDGLIHYYVGGTDAAGFRGARGGSEAAAQIAAWVESTFQPTTIGGTTVYDLTAGGS